VLVFAKPGTSATISVLQNYQYLVLNTRKISFPKKMPFSTENSALYYLWKPIFSGIESISMV